MKTLIVIGCIVIAYCVIAAASLAAAMEAELGTPIPPDPDR